MTEYATAVREVNDREDSHSSTVCLAFGLLEVRGRMLPASFGGSDIVA